METLMTTGARFGERLKARRSALGLTLAELGEATGMHLNGISKIENGLNPNPTWETIVKLCEALDVTPDYFYLPEPGEGESETQSDSEPAKPISKRK